MLCEGRRCCLTINLMFPPCHRVMIYEPLYDFCVLNSGFLSPAPDKSWKQVFEGKYYYFPSWKCVTHIMISGEESKQLRCPLSFFFCLLLFPKSSDIDKLFPNIYRHLLATTFNRAEMYYRKYFNFIFSERKKTFGN